MSPRSETIRQRRAAFQRCFLGDDGLPHLDGEVVLKHLATFCRAHGPAMVVCPKEGMCDTLASALAQGRQEVWQLIMEHLHLDERFIVNLREEPRND